MNIEFKVVNYTAYLNKHKAMNTADIIYSQSL